MARGQSTQANGAQLLFGTRQSQTPKTLADLLKPPNPEWKPRSFSMASRIGHKGEELSYMCERIICFHKGSFEFDIEWPNVKHTYKIYAATQGMVIELDHGFTVQAYAQFDEPGPPGSVPFEPWEHGMFEEFSGKMMGHLLTYFKHHREPLETRQAYWRKTMQMSQEQKLQELGKQLALLGA